MWSEVRERYQLPEGWCQYCGDYCPPKGKVACPLTVDDYIQEDEHYLEMYED